MLVGWFAGSAWEIFFLLMCFVFIYLLGFFLCADAVTPYCFEELWFSLFLNWEGLFYILFLGKNNHMLNSTTHEISEIWNFSSKCTRVEAN